MKIAADENIPQVIDAFSSFGEINLYGGRSITKNVLKDADALLVRSITKVNRELLEGTNVKFVATATIGTDHIDKDYLESKNIYFADAAGCNAFSVAEYVVCAITHLYNSINESFTNKSIGIIGYGNVGTKVAKFSEALGLKTIINDPPLQRKTGEKFFCSLDEALSADIVTFHVPLNKTGIDKTVHLLSEENIGKIKSGAILINSSRGPVVDNNILLNRIKEKNDLLTVLDVWENEPALNRELLELVNLGTQHIAGYSYEGKMNGTTLIYNSFCKFLGTEPIWKPKLADVENNLIQPANNSKEKLLNTVFKNVYDITRDSDSLKESKKLEDYAIPKYFDDLRKNYYVRREFNNYTISLNEVNEESKKIFCSLRFRVI